AAGAPAPGANPLAFGFYDTPETPQPVELEITGTIPSWVHGSLYRGAQAGWDAGNYTAEHWFDGFSRNHKFEIANGKVTYRSRNSADELHDFVQETGRYPGSSFAGDPCKVILGAFQSTFRDGVKSAGNKTSRTVQVSFVKNFPGLDHNSTNFGPLFTLTATTDSNVMNQIDTVTLEPIELFTYQATSRDYNDTSLTCAHPAIGSDGQLFNYVLDVQNGPPTYKIFGINGGKGSVLATITGVPPVYIHTLFSTENYLILNLWQAVLGKTKSGKESYNLVDKIQPWNATQPSLMYVIDKKGGGVVARYAGPTFFAFHEINTFESNGDIYMDMPTFDSHDWTLQGLRLAKLRTVPNENANIDLPSVFTRFKLPNIAGGKAADGTIITQKATIDFQMSRKDGNLEVPRINEKYQHKDYRYAYGIHLEKPGHFADSIVKIDIQSKSSKVWLPSTDHLVSEPVFIPRPGCDDEDDGVLLVTALCAQSKLSKLVVLDAKTMTEVGRAGLPVVMGYGFHGLW
ncbi:carotenoid oxygenase, partial [Lophiotrema nucula]